jgi:hypothetical protein
MTEVESNLMMILMKLALLDSASSEVAGPSGMTRQDGQCEQEMKITSMSASDISRTREARANDSKETPSKSCSRLVYWFLQARRSPRADQSGRSQFEEGW